MVRGRRGARWARAGIRFAGWLLVALASSSCTTPPGDGRAVEAEEASATDERRPPSSSESTRSDRVLGEKSGSYERALRRDPESASGRDSVDVDESILPARPNAEPAELVPALAEVRSVVGRYLDGRLGRRGAPERSVELALERLSGHREEALRFIDGLSDGRDAAVRARAAALLAAIASPSERSLELLLGGLVDDSSEVRRICASGIGSVGAPAATSAVPSLLTLLHDGAPAVKASAALALARIEPDPEDVVPELARLFRGGDAPPMRPFYAHALVRIGLEHGDVPLEQVLACLVAAVGMSPGPDSAESGLMVKARKTSIATLAQLGSAAAPVIPNMLASLDKLSEDERGPLVVAVAEIGGESTAVKDALRRIRDNDEALAVRRAARQALEKLEDGALDPDPPKPATDVFGFDVPPGWRKSALYLRGMGRWVDASHTDGDAKATLAGGLSDVEPDLLPALWSGRALATGGTVLAQRLEGDGNEKPLSYRLSWRVGGRRTLLAIEHGAEVRHLFLSSSTKTWDAPWFRADRDRILSAFVARQANASPKQSTVRRRSPERIEPCPANPSPRRFAGWPPPREAKPGDVWIARSDGRPMVFVPQPGAKHGGFWMDREPVRRADLIAFALAAYRDEFPRTGQDGLLEVLYGYSGPEFGDVPWDLAEEYCRFYGKRLPTAAHWKCAALGCTEASRTDASGTNPYGILHLSDSVWQWCADPPAPDGTRTARGGGSSPLSSTQNPERCSSTRWDALFGRLETRSGWEMVPINPSWGFRCVYDGP